jgi:Putative Flp pilus-assembly TadE/G-like
VLIMVAVWLPVLALFAAFAIDAAHWWDFSRNLQNRADAAALAGGDQLGACLGSPTPPEEAAIGKIAQRYSGPPSGTPDLLDNLPYLSADMAGFTPYYNVPNLATGSGQDGLDFHLLLNSTAFWPAAQNNANGYGAMGSYCHATDPTDLSVCPAADFPNGCAIVDARVSQANVPMFINLLGLHPTVNAHARVVLQYQGSSFNTTPIGVGDAGQTGCMVAQVLDETDSKVGVIAQWTLPNSTIDPGTGEYIWSGSHSVTIPTNSKTGAPDQLAVQAVVPADCSDPLSGGDVYDASHGIDFINTYTPLPGSVPAPTIGSVWLSQTTPNPTCVDSGSPPSITSDAATQDPYFYYFPQSASCTVVVHANVKFPTGSGNGVTVTMKNDDGSPSQTATMMPGSGNEWHASFDIPSESGRHTFSFSWTTSSKSGQFNGGNPLQATFSAFNDQSGGVDDSGPVVQTHVGCDASSPAGCPSVGGEPPGPITSGFNSIPLPTPNAAYTISVAFNLQGLHESGPKDKPILLRSSVQNGNTHRTGILDCGQGPNAVGFQKVVDGGGCGSYPGTSGLTTYPTPAVDWSNCIDLPNNPINCGAPVSGNMRQYVNWAIAIHVCGDKNCSSTPPNTACDNWVPWAAGTGPKPTSTSDPRAIPMVITAPQDLALAPGDKRPIRILGFATFYVTGWDGDPYLPPADGGTTTIPGCNPVGTTPTNVDEPYPGKTTPNNAVWGHFVQDINPGQPGSGVNCVGGTGSAETCTPVLTR